MRLVQKLIFSFLFSVLSSGFLSANTREQARSVEEIIRFQEPDIRYPAFTHFDCVSLVRTLSETSNLLSDIRVQILNSLIESMSSTSLLVRDLVKDALQNESILVSAIVGHESIENFLVEWSMASHAYRSEWVKQWNYKDGSGASPEVDWHAVFASSEIKNLNSFLRIILGSQLFFSGYFGAIAARVNAQRVLLPDYLREILKFPGYHGYGLIRHPNRIPRSIFKGLKFNDKRSLAVLSEANGVPMLILIQE